MKMFVCYILICVTNKSEFTFRQLLVVLNEKQRTAKRKLIEENRERRRNETVRAKMRHDQCYHDYLTEEDRNMIADVVTAYEQTAISATNSYALVSRLCIHI